MSELNCRLATATDEAAWSAFVEAHAGAEAAHLWAFHALLQRCFGAQPHRLIAERGGEIVGLLPLVAQRSFVGRFLTSVPYLNHAGVLADDAETRQALTQAAQQLQRDLNVQRLELRGKHGGDLPLPTWAGKHVYTLDLPETSEPLWSSLKSKVRAQVRRPGKEGFTSRVAGPEALPEFYRLLAQRWHQLGSPILPRRFFEELATLFGDRMRLVFVERDGEIGAAGCLLRWRETVEIPWAASDHRANRFGVNMQLYWASLEHAIESGAQRFDFGRSTPGTGNAKFKLQWGAEEHPLEWNVATDGDQGQASERGDKRRDLVAQTWRRLPAPIVAWLGPHLAARIPY